MSPASSTSTRPPIVVVMGHVDHGKSTLLDYIRKSNVVEGEAGGITQHVAAYEVTKTHEGAEKRITFIDTPGHAAFKSIRSRGANIADIAILVIAADDGVKAQTLEALESIKVSGIPFIVAITKIDKPNADVEKTKYSLLEHGIYLEGLGGDVSWAAIDAKHGTNVDELLDLVLLTAELEDLKGTETKPASGFVIEASRDEKRGVAATVIITDGSMKSGEFMAAGSAVAPLRLFEDHTGVALSEASFSTPVRIFGFDTLPQVGSPFSVHAKKGEAESAAAEAARLEAAASAALPPEGVYAIPLIVKADAAGSLEAILGEVGKLASKNICFHVIASGIGPVTESDVKMAVAAPEDFVFIAAFTVDVDRLAMELSQQYGITIESFNIIYKLTERLAEILKEHKPVKKEQQVTGRARVLKHFSSKHDEHLLGAVLKEGVFTKGARARLIRDDVVVGKGEFLTFQVARQTVDRVTDGEFGTQVVLSDTPQTGDVLETYTEHVA